jgi:hypothetical protein
MSEIEPMASGWIKCTPLLFREQHLLVEVLTVTRDVAPVLILGFDTDNNAVFMDKMVKSRWDTSGVEFTTIPQKRLVHFEQENVRVVRRIVGYRHFERLEAA